MSKLHNIGDILRDGGLVYQVLDVHYDRYEHFYKVKILESDSDSYKHLIGIDEEFAAMACEHDQLVPSYFAVKEFDEDLSVLLGEKDTNEQSES
jgi:hypothetical protein